MPVTLDVIAMNCPNCGASLDVQSELETFACAYCGSTIKVARRGGTISLVRIEQDVGGIRTSTERIAAELALKRLRRETSAVTSEISATEFDLETAQQDFMPMKSFDVSFPLKLNGERNLSASPRHEMTALIKWAAVAVVIGMLFGIAGFVVALLLSWGGILASRESRIRDVEENNKRVTKIQQSLHARLADLRETHTVLNHKIGRQRAIVESE